MDDALLDKVADGRVFTGHQAVDLKLIDQLGDERTAVAWLVAQKGVKADLPVRDYKLVPRFGRSDVFTNRGLDYTRCVRHEFDCATDRAGGQRAGDRSAWTRWNAGIVAAGGVQLSGKNRVCAASSRIAGVATIPDRAICHVLSRRPNLI